ncbi:hypothetical protein [uncultured phage cr25_1]|jgi:hypothetical protein|uniref:Uncharacterized protein n=1 Tax=uncultured phage cr25_1 TaxID=2986395 RepID=A0AAE7RZV7_9CAUD|nr:hypothetical protein M1M55_gp86 [uncultured phage cr25_1]QWM90293.1 hypothetical protein [uncultured phage cr25_1]
MTLRITVECATYNVTINIICSQDVEVSQSDTDITILVRSVKVREKIISFFKFTRIAVKESPVLHKLVISKEPKKVFVKLI